MKTQIHEVTDVFVLHSRPAKESDDKAHDKGSPNVQYVEAQRPMLEEKVILQKHLMTLAHEIKNPLASIFLSNAYLTAELSNPELIVHLNIIERCTKRINEIVLSLIEDTTNDGMEHVILNGFLDEILEHFRDKIAMSGIAIEKQYAPVSPKVCVVRADFQVALNNIILNAIEALPSHGGKLKITTEFISSKCRITIADNGKGISRTDLGKIFQMGFSRKPGGSGVGLAITSRILGEHRALLKVRSKVGYGAAFIIELDAFPQGSDRSSLAAGANH